MSQRSILLLVTGAKKNLTRGWAYCYADGPLPEPVITEFKFEITEGSAIAKADLADCPSASLLLTALMDQHGWTLFSASAGGGNPATQHFVLTKPSTAA